MPNHDSLARRMIPCPECAKNYPITPHMVPERAEVWAERNKRIALRWKRVAYREKKIALSFAEAMNLTLCPVNDYKGCSTCERNRIQWRKDCVQRRFNHVAARLLAAEKATEDSDGR